MNITKQNEGGRAIELNIMTSLYFTPGHTRCNYVHECAVERVRFIVFFDCILGARIIEKLGK